MTTITHPKTGETVENNACTGCYCHEFPIQFGELVHGCCCECGCPKTEHGFYHFMLAMENMTDEQKQARAAAVRLIEREMRS